MLITSEPVEAAAAVALFSPALKFDEEKAVIHPPVTEAAEDVAVKAQEDPEDEMEDVFNPYLFIGSLPPHNSVRDVAKICLPPRASGALPDTTVRYTVHIPHVFT